SPMLIATHCEDEQTIRNNAALFREKYDEEVPIECHPEIRNVEGCYLSSSLAVRLAKKHNSRLHILHISTVDELELFRNDIPLEEKRITAEVCVHHLHFTANDYAKLGTQIKCNPAIKAPHHKAGIWEGLLDDRLDIIATDHAPHTWEEKGGTYFKAPSGVPLVQHSLTLMMQYVHEGRIDWPFLIHKMCHAPAICFQVKERGFLREDYWADVVLIDPNTAWKVEKSNILHKCNWSPFEGETFTGKVAYTFVSGHLAYQNGKLDESLKGKRLEFNRS
ncbi:MAG: dihydroorotase, partial [Bacteroidota bacterium]